jgi:hypothetical protein
VERRPGLRQPRPFEELGVLVVVVPGRAHEAEVEVGPVDAVLVPGDADRLGAAGLEGLPQQLVVDLEVVVTGAGGDGDPRSSHRAPRRKYQNGAAI